MSDMAKYRLALLVILVLSMLFVNKKIDEVLKEPDTLEETVLEISQSPTEGATQNGSVQLTLDDLLRNLTSGSGNPMVAKDARALLGESNGAFLGEGFVHPSFRNLTIQQQQERIHKKMNSVSYECQSVAQYGADEGQYDICLDAGLTPGKCIIYSFGILRDWSFDKDTNGELQCEVHSYDPGIGLEDHEKNKKWYFHDLGIWDRAWKNDKGWDHDTIGHMMQHNRHDQSPIDVVKLHIEGAEWVALDSIIKDGAYENIKQLVVTIHAPRFKLRRETMSLIDYAEVFDTLDRLERVGFRKWSYVGMSNSCCVWFAVLTPRARRDICCAKLYYVNERYL